MKHNTTVEAVKHIDIRGNQLLYAIITTEKGNCIINIGTKTYNQIQKILTTEEEEQNPLGNGDMSIRHDLEESTKEETGNKPKRNARK